MRILIADDSIVSRHLLDATLRKWGYEVVVASDGLGGYSGGTGIEVKRWLLILEGSLPPTLDWQPMDLPADL